MAYTQNQVSNTAADGRISSGRAADGRVNVGRAADGKAGSGRAADGRVNIGRAADGKASSGRAADGRVNVGRAADGKASSGRTVDSRTSFERADIAGKSTDLLKAGITGKITAGLSADFSVSQAGAAVGKDAKNMTAEFSVVTGIAPAANREEVLIDMIDKTEAALIAAPAGSLIIRRPKHKKNGVDYYRYLPGSIKAETYIPRKETVLVQALAQKEYNRKALKLMKQQLAAIKRYHMPCFPGSLDEIYNNLSEERRKLVVPAEPTTAQYIQSWQDIPYPESIYPFDPERPYYTDLGEPVRSKSEVLIANALRQLEVPYKYECPLTLGGGNIIRPDFTLLNIRTRREVYFEHFGMMEDPEYLKSFFRKINLYETNGIFPGAGLICTFESSSHALDTRILKNLIVRCGG